MTVCLIGGASASGSFEVNTGATASEIIGKVFIVHAHDGSRIGCAVIDTQNMAKAFVKYCSVQRAACSMQHALCNTVDLDRYFNYAGALSVSGTVGPISTTGTTLTASYLLSGVDPLCAEGAGPKANSCGVHIHAGSTCDADALGHYFTGAVTADPWKTITYQTAGKPHCGLYAPCEGQVQPCSRMCPQQ